MQSRQAPGGARVISHADVSLRASSPVATSEGASPTSERPSAPAASPGGAAASPPVLPLLLLLHERSEAQERRSKIDRISEGERRRDRRARLPRETLPSI